MLCKVTHCAGHVSANARPHQLCMSVRTVVQLMLVLQLDSKVGIVFPILDIEI